jgi:hypothetical protein
MLARQILIGSCRLQLDADQALPEQTRDVAHGSHVAGEREGEPTFEVRTF